MNTRSLSIRGSVLAISIGLSGCAGAPVGWGGTHSIDYTSPEKIVISYDRTFESYDDIYTIAKQHCEKTGTKANPSKVQKDISTMGLVKIHTFKCVENLTDSEPKESWGHHPNTMGYKSEKTLSFYSEPSGAKIFTTNIDGTDRKGYLCQTPCSVNIPEDKFSGQPEYYGYLSSVWESGAYLNVKLTIQRGRDEYYTFERPGVAGYNIDMSVHNQQERIRENDAREKQRKIENVLAVMVIGAAIALDAKYGYQSTGSGTSIYIPDLYGEMSSNKRSRDSEIRKGWHDIEINRKNTSCFYDGSEYDCDGLTLRRSYGGASRDGWNLMDVNGKSRYCYVSNGHYDCR